MAGGHHDDGSTYSPRIAFIYVFNLIVGTGALALPSVLTTGGWVLGTLFLLLVAFTSFVGVTFMIESMAAANALSVIRHSQDGQYVSDTEPLISDGETAAMLNGGSESDGGSARAGGAGGGGEAGGNGKRGGGGGSGTGSSSGGGPFEIVQRMEMAQMADMFFSDWGRIFFYIALILYLFGDAAIYCTFVPRSLVAFFFPDNPPPWAFDAFLVLFVAVIVPFCFFDFQKTKPLQIVTMVIRNAAITTMIVIAAWVTYTEGPRTTGVPNFRVTALPNLFGGAVYAFMCHHSLPGIITPMREKSFIRVVLVSAFLGVFLLYLLLFLSCGIAFGVGAEDPITFNFSPAKFGWIGDLLFLFPVVTLSSNYPMLTITLRNNLDTLLTLLFPKGSPLFPAAPAFSPRLPPRPSRFSDSPGGGAGGAERGCGASHYMLCDCRAQRGKRELAGRSNRSIRRSSSHVHHSCMPCVPIAMHSESGVSARFGRLCSSQRATPSQSACIAFPQPIMGHFASGAGYSCHWVHLYR
ncbi:unnamed protein product [Closterium sp. Yama58-4]|nr:unnamed protein product [Closterium sp. Yama58-4]